MRASALALPIIVVAAVAALPVTPTGAATAAPVVPKALTDHRLVCHQTYASYAPNGRLDHYGEVAAWHVRLYPSGDHYDAEGDGIDPRGALAGPMTWKHGRARFTDGPFHDPKAGWVLLGRYHRGGTRMPHDPKHGRRFPFVLRSATGRHADLAPPKSERRGVPLSFFYCR